MLCLRFYFSFFLHISYLTPFFSFSGFLPHSFPSPCSLAVMSEVISRDGAFMLNHADCNRSPSWSPAMFVWVCKCVCSAQLTRRFLAKDYHGNHNFCQSSIVLVIINYIYAFCRSFHPKWLSVHSVCAFPGVQTHCLGVASIMLYQLLYKRKVNISTGQ